MSVLTGDDGNNVLDGTEGVDEISGNGGDDTLNGLGGNDQLDGGTGNDILDGGLGDDSLSGGDGNDHLIGGLGRNTYNGGAGDDLFEVTTDSSRGTTFDGGAGTDTLRLVSSFENMFIELDLGQAASVETIDMQFGTLGGTDADDRFDLSGVREVRGARAIYLRGGNDSFVGTLSADRVLGGEGNDTLNGGYGDDYLVGGDGNNTYVGDDGNDVFEVGYDGSRTTFSGGFETDTIIFTHIVELEFFIPDNVEILDFTGGTLAGTNGSNFFNLDFVQVILSNSLIDLAGGDDTFYGSLVGDQVLGGDGIDILNGKGGDDYLDGGLGLDVYRGGGGDDVLVTSFNDRGDGFHGDGGTDTLRFSNGLDFVTFSNLWLLSEYSIEVLDFRFGGLEGTAGGNSFNLSGVQSVIGNSTIELRAGNDYFLGTQVADSVAGGAGDDRLDGGRGADRLIGNDGSDLFIVDDVGDVVVEMYGEGIDTVRSSVSYRLADNVERLELVGTGNLSGSGNDRRNILTGNDGNNRLDGGGGADKLVGGLGDDIYVVDNVGDRVVESEAAGADRVLSSVSFALGAHMENLDLVGDDDINGTGNAFANVLTGNNGNNRLDGGFGADLLVGGGGDDLYIVDDLLDDVVEGRNGGHDAVRSSVDYFLGSFVEDLTLTGPALIGTGNSLANNIFGTNGDNRLVGLGGNDVLDGKLGLDTLIGGLGNDLYIVDDAGDIVVEARGEGTDAVRSSISYALGSNVENLTLLGTGATNGTGNGGANRLVGNDAANHLSGGGGADRITGGRGADVLAGGTGADAFVYLAIADSGRFGSVADRIIDFSVGRDRIDLSAIDANGTLDGDQAFNFIGDAAFSGEAGELRFAGGRLHADVDGDGSVDFLVRIDGVASLTEASFLL